ncbi:hypothetical protein VIGAN_04009500 [Vigna angularis var. angularis]|uniref:non-specific serine/threonine protein kinase n=1 Tax=Vigna angularis var. angularis TaxID=157739 RepID=A0A0S3RR08_PHAAN|nr:LEAF RUST 10 DISEASE-RESISTANCE LOCUS RECEPTOR-LIKE PROTEIN KINASE-like 1.4 isoform X2 [Vigna angularis]BAT83003.1 hypothetical protein VIGAN_04009500 [Vigna angularis var. angularis]
MKFLQGTFFSFLVITITLNQIPTSCADDEHYLKCSSPFQCANLKNLSYPFWGLGRTPYCGHPAFNLQCTGEVATLTLMSESYRVLEVNDSDHRFKLVRTDYWNNICPTILRNITVDGTFFDYGSDTQNLTFYYDCPSFPQSDSVFPWFNCSVNGTQMINYFVTESMLENSESGEIMGACKSRVVVPILESEAKLLETNSTVENLKAVLDNGFGAEWDANNSLCDKCQHSGGYCGHNPSSGEFMCYCRDESSPSTCKNSGKRNNVGVAIGAIVGGVAALVVILGCVYFIIQRRRKIYQKSRSMELFIAPTSSGDTFASTTITSQSLSSYQSSNPVTRSYYFGVQVFTYEELEEATKNFDASRELGEGGFGTVYKGELKDGRTVAVKRHYESNSRRIMQFMNEVQILARLRHKNLVTLFGCTSKHSRELLLVYEFIPNGTVAYHLQGRGSKSTLLPWPIRLNIAVETAEALAYLHANDVIHRDVKTNNILLDDQFCVKVADFGLSRDFPIDVTHVSTAPQGTPGYVDPEYYQCYQLTDKSDVYSFGVVLVELISSLQAVDIYRNRSDVNLSNMAIKKIQNQELHELVDPYLGFEKDPAMRRMITAVAELAFRCLQQERDLRPCMDEVVEILRGIKSDGLGAREETEILDIRTDEAILLKKAHSPVSPNSVVDNWVSGSSVSNSS